MAEHPVAVFLAEVGDVGRGGLENSAAAAKPDRGTYRNVCAALNVEVHSALHVGDLYALDVAAPREASLQAVHLDRADADPLDEPTRIRSLCELPSLRRRWHQVKSVRLQEGVVSAEAVADADGRSAAADVRVTVVGDRVIVRGDPGLKIYLRTGVQRVRR